MLKSGAWSLPWGRLTRTAMGVLHRKCSMRVRIMGTALQIRLPGSGWQTCRVLVAPAVPAVPAFLVAVQTHLQKLAVQTLSASIVTIRHTVRMYRPGHL